jgi:ketosteroid isomerase-like protein
MKKQLVTVAVVLVAVAGFVSLSKAFAADRETSSVLAAVEDFDAALNAMFTGDVRPMERVWSHADDVTYMGPGGGFRRGWKEVFADWESQAALKLGGKVESKEMHVTVGRDLAVVSNYEIGHNVAADGTPQQVKIRATNLFRKENGQWKMIGHQADLLPFLQK